MGNGRADEFDKAAQGNEARSVGAGAVLDRRHYSYQ